MSSKVAVPVDSLNICTTTPTKCPQIQVNSYLLRPMPNNDKERNWFNRHKFILVMTKGFSPACKNGFEDGQTGVKPNMRSNQIKCFRPMPCQNQEETEKQQSRIAISLCCSGAPTRIKSTCLILYVKSLIITIIIHPSLTWSRVGIPKWNLSVLLRESFLYFKFNHPLAF